MDFYHVSDDYIKFLKGIDSRAPHNKSDQHQRPYVGIVLQVGGIDYLAPLSSYDAKQEKFKKDNPTVFKIHAVGDETDKLGLIHINNMIPVVLSEIKKIDFGIQDPKYSSLLMKQYSFILSKEGKIKKRAETLRDAIVNKKDPIFSKFNDVCCDFGLLEANYLNFPKNQGAVDSAAADTK